MHTKFLTKEHEEQRPLEISRHRQENNTKLYRKRIGYEAVDSINQFRVLAPGFSNHGNATLGSIKGTVFFY
jgi:hypothetical protein